METRGHLLWLSFWVCSVLSAQDDEVSVAHVEEKVALTRLYHALDSQYRACDTLEKREMALKRLRQEVIDHPQDYNVVWRAARMTWYVGDWLEDDESRRLASLGKEGMDLANRALALNPEGIEAHYYMALGIATYGRGISIVKALFKGLGGDYENHLKFVLKRNELFDRGGALRAMGRYYWHLPWPKTDLKKSQAYLERARELFPEVLRTHLYLGDTLNALKRREAARKAYETVLAATPDEEDVREAIWVKQQAKKALGQLKK